MRLTFRSVASRVTLTALVAVPLLVGGGCEDSPHVRPETDAGEGTPANGGGQVDDAGTTIDAGQDGTTTQDAATETDAGTDAVSETDAATVAPDAAEADASEDSSTRPSDVCGGFAGEACSDGEFCDYALGDGCDIADGQGVCVPQPEICTQEERPVCGCDGETYSNACIAHSMGVSVASKGKCRKTPPGGETCGPVTCGKGTVCCNALCGICTPPGMSCIQGCEDPDPGGSGATCGGIAALQCERGEFCNYEAGQGCDGTIADAAGRCEVTPAFCTREYRPVCSCDFTTYENRCEAHRAGASVLHERACTSTECEAIGGELRDSNGASIPRCAPGEEDHGPFVGPNGQLPIEPTRCCVPVN